MKAAACAVVHTAETPPRLLWTKRARGVSLGGFHAFPGGVVEAADATLPTDGGGTAASVCALRELFEEVGVLLADGAEALTDAETRALRQAFRRDAAEGAALFVRHGLRFRTRLANDVGRWVTPDVGVEGGRFDTRFFAFPVPSPMALSPDPAEVEAAEWVRAAEALARWGRAEVLVAPPMAAVLKHALTRFDAEAMRCAPHADGTPAPTYEVVPGVVMLPLRTPTLPPATHTNAYLVGHEDAVLIEPASPYPEDIERAALLVETRRATGVRVHAMLATHHHPDHIGGAVALGERLGLPLWAHQQTIDRLVGSVSFDRAIDDGEILSFGDVVLEAVHTPGHAPGHLCFVERRSGVMIAGDMVAGIGTILIEPKDGDMALYLDSLRAIARRAPTMLLPAHGGPIQDAVGKAEHYVAHRLMREEKVYDALVRWGAPAGARELVPHAYDDAPAGVYPIAALAAEAHLIKLEGDGRVSRRGERWAVV